MGIELPKVSTIHSFALRQLLRNAKSTSLPQLLRIADDYEERHIIIEELSDLIHKEVRPTQELLNQLSSDWQKLTADTQNWENKFPDPKFLGAWKENREVYGYTLRAELVYQLKRALEENGEDLDLEGPPKYVIIDEFQDLNACELSVIKLLAKLNSEIYAAGDDDQSIYGFRFASPDGIRNFARYYKPSTNLTLDICKRCPKEILDYGLFVARQRTRRIEKTIKPRDGAEIGEVHVLRFQDQNKEAENIAELCHWLISSREIQPGEILILLRTDRNNKFSDPLREALKAKNIPVGTVTNPLEPLNNEHSREMLCLMRLSVQSDDNLAWRTIVSLGNRRIGKKTLSELYNLARKKGKEFSEIIQEIKLNPKLLSRNGKNVSCNVKKIEEILNKIGKPEKGNLNNWINNLSAKIINNEDEGKKLINIFSKIKEIGDVDSLEDLLRAINVSLGSVEQEKENDKVAILTMHQAKGLSADAVILAAAEDEYIPGRASGEAIDDERRLLYVSLTRARRYLYVTFCQKRKEKQAHTGKRPGNTQRNFTRFLSGGPIKPTDGERFIKSLIN